MKKLIPYLFFLALCCGWVSAQTINYTPLPRFALATSGTGDPPYTALATASGIGQVSYTPTFFVPMCSSTGAPPFSQCTFSGGGSTITCTTSGGLVYWNGTAYVCVAAGTPGTVLTWPSSGSVPAWAAGGGPAAEVHTFSAATEVDFTTCLTTVTSSLPNVKFTITGLTVGSNAIPLIQFSTNGGSSYDTSSTYEWSINYAGFLAGGAGVVTGTSTGVAVFASGSTGVSGSAVPGLSATLIIYEPASTTHNKVMSGTGYAVLAGGNMYTTQNGGIYLSSSPPAPAVNALRLFIGSSITMSGTATCVATN